MLIHDNSLIKIISVHLFWELNGTIYGFFSYSTNGSQYAISDTINFTSWEFGAIGSKWFSISCWSLFRTAQSQHDEFDRFSVSQQEQSTSEK